MSADGTRTSAPSSWRIPPQAPGLVWLAERWSEGVSAVIGDAGPAVDVETVGRFIAHGRWLMDQLGAPGDTSPGGFQAPEKPGRLCPGEQRHDLRRHRVTWWPSWRRAGKGKAMWVERPPLGASSSPPLAGTIWAPLRCPLRRSKAPTTPSPDYSRRMVERRSR